MALRLCDPRTIDIDINSASTSSSSSASAASKYGELRVRQHRKRQPKAPALFLTCLGLRLVLAVLLGGQDVEALLPVAAAGNHITVTDRDPAAAVSTLCSANTAKDSDSSAFAQLSAPVLELITPDGCASFSASDMSSLVRNIQGAVAGGVQLVQLRDYDSDAKSKAEMAARLVAATKDRALLVVNGDPEAARASGADGVHLPERMMEVLGRLVGPRDAGEWPRVVGCSVHSVAAAVKAARLGADYIQVWTVFSRHTYLAAIGSEGPRTEEVEAVEEAFVVSIEE